MNLLECLGVYGWDTETENAVLASLITGDPILLIGKLGSAKTYMPEVLAGALEKRYQSYDASKCLFEDTIGFLDIEKLKRGEVGYLESPITIWDKEVVGDAEQVAGDRTQPQDHGHED
jgi:MoxR-like ATPase